MAEAAGFRACLRCRPYRVPQSVDWGGPELVCRAVAAILDGALDDSTETSLGQRLGISARHLRRLLTAHLGVTPDGPARSARTHFAHRLLDDTDMTITEVAFAAGFGSLRQFNRACKEIFRATPRLLRAKRRKSDRLVADGGLMLRLAFVGPFDLPPLMSHLAERAIPGVEHVSDSVYRRTVVIGGDPGVIELCPGNDQHMVLRAHLPHWEEVIHVAERAGRMAGLDLDLAAPALDLDRDPIIGPLVSRRPGLRPPGTWDPFETGVHAIVGQGIPLTDAATLTGRLVRRFGGVVPGLLDLRLTHTFPPASALADADLDGLGLTHVKAGAIRSFARAVADDAIRLDRSVGLERLVGSLTALGGISARTAHYVALRIGEPDAWPHAALHEVAERWRPWRALAAVHLSAADGSTALRADPSIRPEMARIAS